MNIFEGISDMLSAPITGDLDVVHLFMLVGLVLIAIFIWAWIFHGLRTVASGG